MGSALIVDGYPKDTIGGIQRAINRSMRAYCRLVEQLMSGTITVCLIYNIH